MTIKGMVISAMIFGRHICGEKIGYISTYKKS